MAMTIGWTVIASINHINSRVEASKAKKAAIKMSQAEWDACERYMFPMNASFLDRQEQERLISLHQSGTLPRYHKNNHGDTVNIYGDEPPVYSRNAVTNDVARVEDIDFGEDEVMNRRGKMKASVQRFTEVLDPLRKSYGNQKPVKERRGRLRCPCPECVALRSRARPRSPARQGETEEVRRCRKIDEFRKTGRFVEGGWTFVAPKSKDEAVVAPEPLEETEVAPEIKKETVAASEPLREITTVS